MPDNMPVMTLPKTVLFPGAILPLVIYEDRYKKMLDVALEGDRFFGVVSLDERNTEIKETEPYYETACLGIIRACQKNSDGTSNILIQGLRRVHIEKTLQDFPFRKVEISLLDSESSLPNPSLDYLRIKLKWLLDEKKSLGGEVGEDVLACLEKVKDPEAFIDLAIHSLCNDSIARQNFLETLSIEDRYDKFTKLTEMDILRLKMFKEMSGDVDPDSIGKN